MITQEPRGDALKEARKVLRCLYIAVEKHVADDVNGKVNRALDDLEARVQALEAELEKAKQVRNRAERDRVKAEAALRSALSPIPEEGLPALVEKWRKEAEQYVLGSDRRDMLLEHAEELASALAAIPTPREEK